MPPHWTRAWTTTTSETTMAQKAVGIPAAAGVQNKDKEWTILQQHSSTDKDIPVEAMKSNVHNHELSL